MEHPVRNYEFIVKVRTQDVGCDNIISTVIFHTLWGEGVALIWIEYETFQ